MANIIINNYCNQKCDYCFAWKNMEDPSLKNEMDIKTFLYCLKHLKVIWDDRVRILWWEPLLHKHITEIFRISVKGWFFMTIFSNFKIPVSKWEKILDFWESYDYSRLKFNLNLNDKDFYKQLELDLIYGSLDFLTKKWCDVVISYNVYEYSWKYDFIFDTAIKFWIKNVILKVTNTIMWDEELIDTNDKKYWDYLFEITSKYYEQFQIAFSCWLSSKIFSASEKEFLTQKAWIKLMYGCENNGGKYDINTDWTIYRCFPLQSIYDAHNIHITQDIFQKNSLSNVRKFLEWFVPREKWLVDDENCLGNQLNKI
jgi:MoaA/NifB/PqqE/SkfB family radical SAM enzyme